MACDNPFSPNETCCSGVRRRPYGIFGAMPIIARDMRASRPSPMGGTPGRCGIAPVSSNCDCNKPIRPASLGARLGMMGFASRLASWAKPDGVEGVLATTGGPPAVSVGMPRIRGRPRESKVCGDPKLCEKSALATSLGPGR
eukprot:scaffold176073_cov32-Tisochrysis_lutea.AAC.3